MKIFHLSDLHLGKNVNGFSMIEDQKYILNQIVDYIKSQKADAVIIAGDVYDKNVPSLEAVNLFDDFLFKISSFDISVYIISGNHDSAVRIAFGNRLMNKNNVYISPVYKGNISIFNIENVNIYLMPFIKPANVRVLLDGENKDIIKSYNDAVKYITDNIQVDDKYVNIMVAHQFISGASICESEELSVGGLDQIDYRVFDKFDYVALGHLHGPQHIGREYVRYCGSPLKYSFSEKNHKKSITVIDIENKNIEISTLPLAPIRDMIEIKDSFDEILYNYEKYTASENYMSILLTDKDEVLYAVDKLRNKFPNIMQLRYVNSKFEYIEQIENITEAENKSPIDWISEFYHMNYGCDMSDEESEYISNLIKDIWEGEK